jgi:hypothetical protein
MSGKSMYLNNLLYKRIENVGKIYPNRIVTCDGRVTYLNSYSDSNFLYPTYSISNRFEGMGTAITGLKPALEGNIVLFALDIGENGRYDEKTAIDILNSEDSGKLFNEGFDLPKHKADDLLLITLNGPCEVIYDGLDVIEPQLVYSGAVCDSFEDKGTNYKDAANDYWLRMFEKWPSKI